MPDVAKISIDKGQTMSRRIRSMAVTVVAMVAMVGMFSTAALAQSTQPYPPGQAFSVVCTSAGQAGASVACRVLGAIANERLTATAAYNPEFYREELTANADGEANFRFTVPREARGREITVRVVGEISGEVASDTLTIAAPGRSGEAPGQARGLLAYTGQDTILLAAAGLVLLTGGILGVRRRRVGERVDA